MNRDLPAMLDAVRRAQQAAAERAAAEIAARQDQFDRALAGLSDQTRKIEADTSRRLRARTAQLQGQMVQAVDQVRREARGALEEQERQFEEALAQERRERVTESRALRDALADLRQGHDRAVDTASRLVADAALLRDTIASSLPHERFAPGRLAEIGRRLELAEDNIAQRLGEAALAQAQDAYLQFSELRAEIELRQQAWQLARSTAVSAVMVLQEQIKLNTTIGILDEDGAPMDDVTLDVDFWSEGELAEIRAEVDKLAGRMTSDDDPLTVEELREITETEIPCLDEKLTSIVATARVRQLASQVRVNLAELVVNTLEESAGYSWEEGQAIYANGDQRRTFYSKLRHLDSSEIVVEVAPDETGESSVLRILSYDAGVPDEEERVRRAHAIVASLREHGLEVGIPTADQEPPDPGLTDFERIRRPLEPAQQAFGTTRVVRGEPE